MHDGMPIMVQIRNVPESLHRKLKARAALAGMSLSDYLLGELRRSAETPTREELLERIGRRVPAKLTMSARRRRARGARGAHILAVPRPPAKIRTLRIL